MGLLHPVYLILFVFMLLYSFVEVSGRPKNPVIYGIIVAVMVIMAGFRFGVGGDYGVYEKMYNFDFPTYIQYQDIWDKMLFRENSMEIEWLYVLMNRVLLDNFAAPFFIFTFITACFAVITKMVVFYKNSTAPVLAVLTYFIPTYFIADSGQMRQGLAMAVCMVSYEFIKKRRLLPFLFCMFIAFGLHKSTIVFLPCYWVVNMRVTRNQILVVVLVCMALSPLQLYEKMGFLTDTVSIDEISKGFNGYVQLEAQDTGVIKLMDIVSLFYLSIIYIYNDRGCREIWYFEYLRNIVVMGICLYFIMRGNSVFSTRLVTLFYLFMGLIFSNILVIIRRTEKRDVLYTAYTIFLIVFLFTFANIQSRRLNFSAEGYKNYLWLGSE